MVTTISLAALQALIASYCNLSNVKTPAQKDAYIACITTAVNCIIIEDGSKIYKEQVRRCLK